MRLPPVFAGREVVAAARFRAGLCLPSGTALSKGELVGWCRRR